MSVSFQVKEVADIIEAMTVNQFQELVDHLAASQSLYLGRIPMHAAMVYKATKAQQPPGTSSDQQWWVEDVAKQNIASKRELPYGGRPDGTFAVCLESYLPQKKIAVIKVIRELTGFSLAEAKRVSETTPTCFVRYHYESDARHAASLIEDVGGFVSIKNMTD